MFRYERPVQYYETDAMQVVHHSNYFRWFEEARQYAMVQMGAPYPEVEARGLVSPVLTINCEYHKSARYGDVVEVRLSLVESKSIRSRWNYAVVNKATGEVLTYGSSTHCFLRDGEVVSLKRECPDLYEKLMNGLSGETCRELGALGKEE